MGVGSGVGSSVGFAPEVTYGTYVAPSKWLDGTAALRRNQNTYQGGGMAAGRLVRPGARRYKTHEGAAGTFAVPVLSKGMGHLLNGLMGGTVTPVQQGATAAYLQTHPLTDPVGKWYTFQSGVPDTGGTVRPYTFLGTQIVSAEFAVAVGGTLMATFDTVCRQAVETETLAAPSYPANNEFHFGQAALKLGAFGAEASVDGVRSVSVRIGRPLHDGGPYMGSQGLRSRGVLNDFTPISGTIEADFLDKTVFADRFVSGASTSLVLEFVGPLIASTFFETFRIRLPQIFFDGDTPTAEGPDVVRTSFPFIADFDGTNPAASIEYISTDITL